MAQAVVAIVVVAAIVRSIAANWDKVREQPAQWGWHPAWIVASLLLTWLMYLGLVLGWRAILQGWHQQLTLFEAARIWALSNLGKYIPGKVWSIAGMAVMAQQRGISGAAATGSAIIMQLLSIATGTMLALALTGRAMLDRVTGGSIGAMILAGCALGGAMLLTVPAVTTRIGSVLRRPDSVRPVPLSSLLVGLFANLVAWCGYGAALQWLARGTLRNVDLPWITATGAFAASYVIGYLTLFLPGGIGAREAVMVVLLRGTVGEGPAVALAAASRLTLTINELGAAVPFLRIRRRDGDER